MPQTFTSAARNPTGHQFRCLRPWLLACRWSLTDLLSNREWITEGQNGWLAPVGSAERFAERMLRAANLSIEEKEAISRRNQQIVCQRADWDRNFPALMDMYERLLGEAVRKQ